MRREHRPWVMLVVLVLAAASLEAGHVVSVTLCEDVIKPDMVPVNIRTRFTTDAPAIHALAVLEDVRPGARVRGAWISVDAISTPNYEIDSAEVVTQGSEITAHFSLSRPNKGWPAGNYKLNLYLDGKLVSVTTFSIVGTAGAPAGQRPRPAEPPSEGAAPPPAPASQEPEPQTGFSGTYVMEAQGTTLTLTLRQDARRAVTGTLTSSTGARFELEGQVDEEGTAIGICSDGQTKVYFEAQQEGNQLALALIEPDANGMPDYNRARQLMLTRRGGGVPAARRPIPGLGTDAGGAPRRQAEGPVRGNEVGDASWGFRFRVPPGWKEQHDESAAILGHDTIAGVILVIPHMSSNLQEVQQQMQEGLSDEKMQLRPTGGLRTLGNNALAGDYEGFSQNQQVRARGIGTASPQGGAYILAVATPEKYTRELAAAAEAIAASLRYVEAQMSDVAQYFVGTWVTMTTNTQTSYTLSADGTFTGDYEVSYSGNRAADGTTGWGLARQNQERGRWTVRGTREQGVVILRYPDGRQETVEYRVHVEKGETYWNEYWFDGTLYGRR